MVPNSTYEYIFAAILQFYLGPDKHTLVWMKLHAKKNW